MEVLTFRRDRFSAASLWVAWLTLFLCLTDRQVAWAVEGSVIDGQVSLWAPMLPAIREGASDSGNSVGGLFELSGHHRFDGYRTSIEAGIEYGITDAVELFAFEAILRDTWSFGIGDLSAGGGYSHMQWEQTSRNLELTSDYNGGKIVSGWETVFGRQPVWIDLSLGLYDLNARSGGGLPDASLDRFTTTWAIKCKFDCDTFGIPMRTVFGIDYLNDIATWENGRLGTEDAWALTTGLEFWLF